MIHGIIVSLCAVLSGAIPEEHSSEILCLMYLYVCFMYICIRTACLMMRLSYGALVSTSDVSQLSEYLCVTAVM